MRKQQKLPTTTTNDFTEKCKQNLPSHRQEFDEKRRRPECKENERKKPKKEKDEYTKEKLTTEKGKKMNNQNPNDTTTLTAGPKEEEILEQNLQRFREDTRKYITEELNQAGWTLVPQNTDGTPMNPGMNLASQADAMAYIIADKLVREGRVFAR